MVKLNPENIQTKEILEWKGIHLLNFANSSCSQKLRIYLNLKNIDWKSHEVNLATGQNYSNWFLGINPNGLVPVLVDNGDVEIGVSVGIGVGAGPGSGSNGSSPRKKKLQN